MVSMTNIDEVLASLDKKTLEGIQKASEVTIEKQPLPSIGQTRALRGGLKYGAFHLFWGPTGSGKTLAAYQTLALAQKSGKVCVLVDAEGAFTEDWAKDLGIDPETLIIITHRGMETVTNKLTKLLQAGVDMILIDSISELTPPGEFEKDGELKEMSGTGAIGAQARGLRAMLGKLANVNHSALILLISQQTTEITQNGGIQKPQGGNRVKHIVNTSIKFGSNLAEKHRIMGDIEQGDIILQKVTGRPVTWFIDKDRGPGMHEGGGYDIYFDGDYKGIDNVSELVDYGIKYGIIAKGGAWLTIYDERVQGRAKAIEYVRQNPAVRDTLEGDLLAV